MSPDPYTPMAPRTRIGARRHRMLDAHDQSPAFVVSPTRPTKGCRGDGSVPPPESLVLISRSCACRALAARRHLWTQGRALRRDVVGFYARRVAAALPLEGKLIQTVHELGAIEDGELA